MHSGVLLRLLATLALLWPRCAAKKTEMYIMPEMFSGRRLWHESLLNLEDQGGVFEVVLTLSTMQSFAVVQLQRILGSVKSCKLLAIPIRSQPSDALPCF